MSALDQNQSYALIADLGKLADDRPVDGSMILLGRQVIEHGSSWSDEKAGKLGRVVDALCSPLRQAGRSLDALILEYEEGALLLVTREALRVVVVLRQMVDRPDELISEARRILDTHGETLLNERTIAHPLQTQPRLVMPKPTAAASVASTTNLKPIVDSAANQATLPVIPAEPKPAPGVPASVAMELAVARLAMVMSRKTASDLVARESAKAGIVAESLLDAAKGREFIDRIFSHIPHKAKRESLTFECQSLFLESLS
jgi:hypothetical protein